MSPALQQAFALLPNYLASHLLVSLAALLLGAAISLPLAVLASRNATLRWPLLAFASFIQTIPSLALLALFYPVLLALSTLTRSTLGVGFPALGFLPSLLALTLYSMLPMLRNTVTGLAGVDPASVEAARGVGMTDRQRLTLVELPLAAPVIMAGVRTAAVLAIGTATLAAFVGGGGLGDPIVAGLALADARMVLSGAIPAALMALAVDGVLAAVERRATPVAMRARGRRNG